MIEEIRKYRESDIEDLWNLFYSTIHCVNINDYNAEQVEAWAPTGFDISVWKSKIKCIDPFVVTINSKVVAYGDIQTDGLIDHFFCHHEYQRKGVGSKLYSWLEECAYDQGIDTLWAEVSITAKPFFQSKGFHVVKEQVVPLRGQQLKNHKMVKNVRAANK